LTSELARQWIASTFDVFLEVGTLRDGRHRVLRVAEPVAADPSGIQTRDIFTLVVERTATGGLVEGTFQASGSQPRVVDEMTARGISVDSGLFSRPPSR
jgi:pilus assembly protein CpaF